MVLNRRTFLAGSAGAAVVASTTSVPRIWASANRRASLRDANRVLVVIQLSGGNDGLNTVIPYADDAYHRNRFATRIQATAVKKIDDYIGWHPSLDAFGELQQAGRLCIVQGVGYPNPNRSHFESMDIWHSARLVPPHRAGWLGRWFDEQAGGEMPNPVPGLHIGDEPLPLAMSGLNLMVPSLQSIESLRTESDEMVRAALDQVDASGESRDDLIDFLRRARQTALTASRQLDAIDGGSDLPRGFPRSELARKLAFVAKLIAIDFGPRVYYVSLGSFDTHSQQSNAHAALLNELGGAVAAFHRHLATQGDGDSVLTVCFSEFGRRVKENGSAGTDHGTAAPLFLAGPELPAKLGKYPSLTDLVDGDLVFNVDFRSVYAALLEQWLQIESQPILGQKYPVLKLQL
jgi:uncharacterized protein (DUF1501 family)